MKPIHGKLMMATGVIHTVVVGIPLYWNKWQEFAGMAFLNIAPHELNFSRPIVENLLDIHAEAALWFFIAGAVFFILGHVIHSLETHATFLPAHLGWELLLLGVASTWMMPISGFPIFMIPQALYMIIRQKKFRYKWQRPT